MSHKRSSSSHLPTVKRKKRQLNRGEECKRQSAPGECSAVQLLRTSRHKRWWGQQRSKLCVGLFISLSSDLSTQPNGHRCTSLQQTLQHISTQWICISLSNPCECWHIVNEVSVELVTSVARFDVATLNQTGTFFLAELKNDTRSIIHPTTARKASLIGLYFGCLNWLK